MLPEKKKRRYFKLRSETRYSSSERRLTMPRVLRLNIASRCYVAIGIQASVISVRKN